VLEFLGKAGGYVFYPGRIEEIIKRAAEPSLNGPAAFLFFGSVRKKSSNGAGNGSFHRKIAGKITSTFRC
jgi:hypothetical protein